jgi:hypothetical protein
VTVPPTYIPLSLGIPAKDASANSRSISRTEIVFFTSSPLPETLDCHGFQSDGKVLHPNEV